MCAFRKIRDVIRRISVLESLVKSHGTALMGIRQNVLDLGEEIGQLEHRVKILEDNMATVGDWWDQLIFTGSKLTDLDITRSDHCNVIKFKDTLLYYAPLATQIQNLSNGGSIISSWSDGSSSGRRIGGQPTFWTVGDYVYFLRVVSNKFYLSRLSEDLSTITDLQTLDTTSGTCYSSMDYDGNDTLYLGLYINTGVIKIYEYVISTDTLTTLVNKTNAYYMCGIGHHAGTSRIYFGWRRDDDHRLWSYVSTSGGSVTNVDDQTSGGFHYGGYNGFHVWGGTYLRNYDQSIEWDITTGLGGDSWYGIILIDTSAYPYKALVSISSTDEVKALELSSGGAVTDRGALSLDPIHTYPQGFLGAVDKAPSALIHNQRKYDIHPNNFRVPILWPGTDNNGTINEVRSPSSMEVL